MPAFNPTSLPAKNLGIPDIPQWLRDIQALFKAHVEREHTAIAGNYGGTITGGEHAAGSAKVFYDDYFGDPDAGQTVRPDGITPLGVSDAGRLLIDSSNNSAYVWDGTAWLDKVFPYKKADAGGTQEWFIKDEAGNEIQLTSGGKLRFASLDNLANATYLKAVDEAGTGTVDLIKAGRNEADDADVAILPDAARLATNAAPTEATQIANKKYVDDAIDATGLVWSDHVNITAVGGKYTAPGTGVLLVQIGNYAHAGWHHNVDLYNSSNTLLFTFRAAAGYNSYSSHTVPVNTGDYITITGLHLGTPSVHFKGIGIAT